MFFRCLNCIFAKKADDLSITIDGGKWYAKKVQEVLSEKPESSLAAIPLLPVTGWKKFPSGKIPEDFCYGTIYEHIISSAKLIGVDGEPGVTANVHTAKPITKGRFSNQDMSKICRIAGRADIVLSRLWYRHLIPMMTKM